MVVVVAGRVGMRVGSNGFGILGVGWGGDG